MAGRPRIYNDENIIDKAIEVFRGKCFDAASTDELLAAMGIGKGSFYLNFKGGKEELYQRSLKRFAENLNRKMEAEMERSGDAMGYIKNLFLKMANIPSAQKDRGCYYGDALVQLSAKDKANKELAVYLLKDLHRIFTSAVKSGQEQGKVAKDKDPETLGWYLINFWNGIHITKRMEKSPEILKSIIEGNFKLLE
ncbi:TetR/AcrR family transcriptional regulator [Mucilaginibacter conchicola]|uniref:TetR/AcrR family transcriptional regulator n=1 Tax=Mucilaginibacter conchicola TaxID=2303333 RepID=A0A372NNX2_9SPHI|nr:TetR/AcrR family transcriptional regulator [Mucilaginibacter conchicola]RFZ90624.1 TetR/AcrR family transcriptional regulator [Mucilaginibacter conchicola]